MAGRDFGSYDADPFRDFTNNMGATTGMNQGSKGGPSLPLSGNQSLLPLLMLLMRGQKGQISPQLIQQILALLGGKR